VRLGYALLHSGRRGAEVVEAGTLTAPSGRTVAQRLAVLQARLRPILERYRPAILAVETSFHGKNPQSLLRLGEARGMVIGLAGFYGIEVRDYTPAMIKKSVTGNGNAGKESVARMVQAMVQGVPRGSTSDTTDAIAAALCHLHRGRLAGLAKRSAGPRGVRFRGAPGTRGCP
jgi:crossover junction endodeoxyribonuclease RuvC